MLSEQDKQARRDRNVYCVDGQSQPATHTQLWNNNQLCTLDLIRARIEFDYWVQLCMGQQEYATDWKPGPRTVLYFDKNDKLHTVTIGRRRILRELGPR